MTAIILSMFLLCSPCTLTENIQNMCIEAGEEKGILPELLMSIIETESAGDPEAENNGCKGLMQVYESVHKDRMKKLGVKDLYEPEENIKVGTDILLELFEQYEDTGLVLDLYNGNSKAFYNFDNGILSGYSKRVLERAEELENYMESIMGYEMDKCMVCESPYVEIHHCIKGTANRKVADKYGLTVPLCREHHTGNNGVHLAKNKKFDIFLMQKAQQKFEEVHGTREDFIKAFGKSWL